MKYQDLYRWGFQCLEQAGIEESSLDARILLESVCNTDRNTLLAHGDREVEAKQEEMYRGWIDQRAKHIPVQHLTGEQEFMGLVFRVSANVLIPRQDTEILVEEAMRELHDGMRILDMCTGSGCILLSLLHYSNHCTGTGTDISPKALEIAKNNAASLSLEAEFLESDLFTGLDMGMKFDMLVSNPPYIPSAVIPGLMEEVREHEPLCALDGKEDGLYFYRRISSEAKPFLFRGSFVFLEIGYDQGQAVTRILSEAGYQEIEVIKDFAGHDRVVKGIYMPREQCEDTE